MCLLKGSGRKWLALRTVEAWTKKIVGSGVCGRWDLREVGGLSREQVRDGRWRPVPLPSLFLLFGVDS